MIHHAERSSRDKWLWIRQTVFSLVCLLVISACTNALGTGEITSTGGSPGTTGFVTESQLSAVVETATSTPTPQPVPTKTATISPTPAPTETPTVTPTPDPYAAYAIEYLDQRSYGGEGQVEIIETLGENDYFTRYLFSYPSDGLMIYGFLNIPKGQGTQTDSDNALPEAYPVVIALHGYIDPEIYDTIDYTTRYADSLAREGYLVLHPNLRGYPPSDDGGNLFRVGMAVDVLNLIALVVAQAGQPGALEHADASRIGLWGHSMGGGISTRVMTVSSDVDAVVLYGAMSGDDRANFERIYGYFSNGTRGLEELDAPEEAFQRISPINYLDQVNAAVSIHHGKLDPDVPLAWSLDLCRRLRDLQVEVECFTYDGQAHTFHGEGDVLLMQRTVLFYDRYLKEGE